MSVGKGTRRNPNKSLKDIIAKWSKDNIETTTPAVVVGVKDYPTHRIVDVQPLVIENEQDGDAIVPNTIYGCPVALQGTLNGYTSFPMKVGDTVALGYCKRSVEEVTYGQNTDPVQPEDNRVFSSSDAIVLGYWGQRSKDFSVSADNYETRFHNAYITMDPNSVIQIFNGDVVQQIDDGWAVGNGEFNIIFNADGTAEITTSQDIKINNCIITSGGNVITAAGTDLDNFKANFDALVISYNTHGAGAPNHNPPVPPYTPV